MRSLSIALKFVFNAKGKTPRGKFVLRHPEVILGLFFNGRFCILKLACNYASGVSTGYMELHVFVHYMCMYHVYCYGFWYGFGELFLSPLDRFQKARGYLFPWIVLTWILASMACVGVLYSLYSILFLGELKVLLDIQQSGQLPYHIFPHIHTPRNIYINTILIYINTMKLSLLP